MNALTSFRLTLVALAVSVSAFAAERFQVKVTGHGRPLLLIPGLSCSGEVWDATVARYQDRYECHVFTLAGFAGVPAAEGEFIAPVREALADYIGAQKLDHPIVIGHSLGGFLAADLAATHPELIGPVVVVDAYPFLSGIGMPGMTLEAAKARAAMFGQQMAAVPDESYRQGIQSGMYTRSLVTQEPDHQKIIQWSLRTDRKVAAQAMVEMLGSDLRDKLANTSARFLVLVSAPSLAPYIPPANVEEVARSQYQAVKHLQFAVSGTARHFLMYDAPEWFNSQVDTFLATQP